MINSNYYILDSAGPARTHVPAARAGALVHMVMQFKRLVDREELEPMMLRGTVPICMNQVPCPYA
jgi:hypothetical protein